MIEKHEEQFWASETAQLCIEVNIISERFEILLNYFFKF